MARHEKLELLYSRDALAAGVAQLAEKISQEYLNKDLVVIGILKGAAIFMSDLVREMTIPLEMDFMRVESYGSGTTTCGEPRITAFPAASVEGRHVLIVEDIVDTGVCVKASIDYIEGMKPASVKLCALLDKPARRTVPIAIDFTGFTIPDRFVVGYGLDLAQRYRNLPEIFVVEGTDLD